MFERASNTVISRRLHCFKISIRLLSGALRLVISAVLGAVVLVGCGPKIPDRLGAPIEGYNHTAAAINWFMVNRNGGPNVDPYGGGGKQNCCVSLPRKWHPGLTVLVEWEKDPTPYDSATFSEPRFSDAWSKRMEEQALKNTQHSATVEVAPYEDLALVYVHFLPCNQIKVSAGVSYPGHPKHPFKFPRRMEEPTTCPTP